eukprot:SAG25_NODE_1_length_41698_cov_149.842015_28_plen_115_part_00
MLLRVTSSQEGSWHGDVVGSFRADKLGDGELNLVPLERRDSFGHAEDTAARPRRRSSGGGSTLPHVTRPLDSSFVRVSPPPPPLAPVRHLFRNPRSPLDVRCVQAGAPAPSHFP